MQTYDTTVEYETKKGNLKTAQFKIDANNLTEATERAKFDVMNNGQRQAKKITTVRAVRHAGPFTEGRTVVVGANRQQVRKRGFFARLFGRG